MSPPKAIATPCIKVCVVDGASGLCLGCLRTLPEIAEWALFTDERREQVMADCSLAVTACLPKCGDRSLARVNLRLGTSFHRTHTALGS